MKWLLHSVVLMFGFSSCDLNSLSTSAEADFVIMSSDDQMTIESYGEHQLINQSKNSIEFEWDLGNGVVSNEKEPSIIYFEPGVYTVTLKAKSKSGDVSIKSRQVKVVEKVLQQVIIKNLNWNSYFNWKWPGVQPNFDKADVWVEIKEALAGTVYTISPDGDRNAPTIFKSQVLHGVDSTIAPFTLLVNNKIPIHIPTITGANSIRNFQYGINLYAKDATGTYLLSSTFWGMGYSAEVSFPNYFTMRTGIDGIAVDLQCKYE